MTLPVVGSMRPAITLSKVVFPHPLGPKMAVSLAAGTFSETFSSATIVSWYVTPTPSVFKIMSDKLLTFFIIVSPN